MSIYPGVVAKTLNVGRCEVSYFDGGSDRCDGAPIVLIHGTGGRCSTHFFTLYPMLASRHRVIGIDLSDVDPDGQNELTIESLSSQVLACLDSACASKPALLVGYSLGAAVAVSAASRSPASVAGLVLMNGWAKSDNLLRLRISQWQTLRASGNMSALAETMILNVYSRAFLSARSWTDVEQMCEVYAVGPGSDRQMALNKVLDVSKHLENVACPALVIGSTYDQLIPLSYSQELAGGIRDAAFAEVHCGHGSVTERPAEIFRLIDKFSRDMSIARAQAYFSDNSLNQLNVFSE
ncbi:MULTISPECIES: alpha/beta fold hydrolase [Caballeronia]|uniref:alpha/beta fold hydrolase n=1 Tax=Caballeronia TaxID=1827195 RepID=UPI001FD134DC|nr:MULTISPECIES: alpha/beta hydrolase [Caballeronia]MDR5799116.1 alpha/beta hydrolase [Caballeronia sp. LZ001]